MGTLDVDHTGEINGKQDQYQDPDPDQNFAADSYLDLCASKSPDPRQTFRYQTQSLWFALISASFTFSTHCPSTTAGCIDSPDTYLE